MSSKIMMFVLGSLAAALAAFSVFADGGMEREVHLKKHADVWTQNVCLGDVVEEGWVQSRCSIKDMNCCRWTLEGQRTRDLSRRDIEHEMSKVNFGGIKLQIKGEESVQVTQIGRELRAAEIQARILEQFAAKLGDPAAKSALAVTSLKIPMPIYTAFDSESDWDAVLPENPGTNGQNAIKIVSTKDAGRVMGWAHAALAQMREAYVARKTIRPSEKVRREDFDLRKADVLPLQISGGSVFKKDQFPEGTRAKNSIGAGSVLSAASIEREPQVQLGDAVTLILRSDNLRVSTKGVVQGSAAVGDMVTVQLQRYNRTFRGRLMEGRLVEVWL